MIELEEILGAYFPYCQFCVHDSNCVLLHHEFMGTNSQGETDKSAYPGHEDLSWHLSGFQGNSSRSTCDGRIHVTSSIYFPLACRCGTVISSLVLNSLLGGFCHKFSPNELGQKREAVAQKLLAKRGVRYGEEDISTDEYLTEKDLLIIERIAPFNLDYHAHMRY